MGKLINIENRDNTLVVSSREVARNFGKRPSDLNRLIDDLIKDLGGVQNCTHLFIESEYQHEQNRQWYREFLLTRDGFTLVVMGFTGAPALAWKLSYINAFNTMEEALKQQSVKAVPQTYLEALKALVASEEEKIALAEKVEEQEVILTIQAPKVEYHDKVLDATNGINTTIIAKELGMTARGLNQLLKEKGVQYKCGNQWFLKAKYQNQGLTEIATFTYEGTLSTKTSHHTKWTEKGRKFIHDLVAQ